MTRWKVYKCREGVWEGAWIVQPPGCTFDESFAFLEFIEAWQYATDQASMEKS